MIRNISMLSLVAILMLGCGGSSGDTTDKNTNTTTTITDKQSEVGNIIVNPTNNRFFREILNSSGTLIATPDKISLGINNALAISSSNIKKQEDGSYLITNIPKTTDASITYRDKNGNGFTIDNITVKGGETTNLGSVSIKTSHKLNLEINSSILDNVWLNINDVNITSKLSLENIENGINTFASIKSGDLNISNIPQGHHFLTISDINGNIILSKYIDVNDSDINESFNLDNIIFNGVLDGKLIDTRGNPLKGATIYLKPAKDSYLIALTQDDGSFKFQHLPKGIYTIMIQKSGFKAKTIKDVDLSNLEAHLGNIQLEADTTTGSIAGYVYFSDTTQHAGIDITVQRLDGEFETKQNGSLIDGAFLISNLPAGKYKLLFGKSSDSSYSQVTSREITVLAGVTTTLENSYVLQKQTGEITGEIELPKDITEVNNINVEVVDSSSQVVATSKLVYEKLDENGTIYTYDLIVPVGDNYKLVISGTDQNGAQLKSVTKDIASITSGNTLNLDLMILSYVDPNPPVIKTISVIDKNRQILKDNDGNYLVNPDDELAIEVLAQDKDGDKINYYFNSTSGKFLGINQELGKSIYQSPSVGGLYSINITAKSNYREDKKTIPIHVNHYPQISLVSDNSFLNSSEPPIFKTSDFVIINTNVTDVEDDTNVSIEWKSNIQGELDKNVSVLKKQLLPGNHIITEVVTDSMGLTTTKEFYVKVDPIDMVWLKVPNIYLKLYNHNLELEDSYQLNLGQDDLSYESLDTSVVTVDSVGKITSVASGSTKIRAYSTQTDENGNPIYEQYIPVRVIDKLSNQNSDFKLQIGQVMQIKVTKDNENDDGYISLPLDLPYYGNYEVVFFDQKDIVADSKTEATLYVNGNKSSNTKAGVSNTIFGVDMVDKDSSYEMRIKPYYSDDEEYIKVALVPADNVKDDKGNSLTSIVRDGDYEFNDIAYTAKNISLNTIYNSVIYKYDYDKYDWYNIHLQKGKYVFEYTITNGTNNGYLYAEIFDSSGNRLKYEDISNYTDKWIRFYIDVAEDDDYKIAFHNSSYAAKTYYKFNLIPSLKNGLKQDPLTFEPNNYTFNAYYIKKDTLITSDVNKIEHDNVDYYSIYLEKGNYAINFNLLNQISGGYVYLQWYDMNGDELSNTAHYLYNTDTWDKYIVSIPENGLYTLKIYNSNNYYSKYSFNVQSTLENGLVQDNITYEPNDFKEDAYPIELNQEINSSMNYIEHDFRDEYSLNLQPGKYKLNISFDNDIDDYVYIYIYDPTENKIVDTYISYPDKGDSKSISFEVLSAGKYIISISDDKVTYYNMEVIKDED